MDETTEKANSALQAFESAWESGVVDDFESAIPFEARSNTDLLTDLVCIDLPKRLQRDGETRVETYTAVFPQLASNELVLLELIRTEYLVRANDDSPPGVESYCGRFPHLSREIERMFQLEFNHSSSIHSEEGPYSDWKCSSCGAVVVGRDVGATDCRECGQRIAIGRYELLERVGQGAFGYVYRAWDPKLDREVAVKLPRSNRLLMPDESERFLRESRHVAKLDHPGIVRVFDAGRQEGVPYIVSEFAKGRPLSTLIAEREFGYREAAQLVVDIAKAVAHAHHRGVIHRDLKPANIMTNEGGEQLETQVMDFGLARRNQTDTTVTIDGQAIGTPAYMSPEQACGELSKVGPQSDVFSIGIILYQLLSGELPFRGSIQRLMQQVIDDDAPPPTRFRASIPRDLETICLKSIERDVSSRYGSATELVEELDRWLEGKPILARPVSIIGRFSRWCKRRPLIAGLSTALCVALIGGFAGVINQWMRAEDNAKAYRLKAAENLLLAKSESEANEKAQIEKETAVAVKEFMNEVFAAARSPRKGRLPTILEAVDSASRRVGGKFEDRPLVEANVRFAIGQVYRGQGDRAAIPQFQRAIELFQSIEGDDGKMRLKSMDRLAGVYRALNDSKAELVKAKDLRAEVVERLTRTLGENHADTLITLNNLALVYHELEDYPSALKMYERVLKGLDSDPTTERDRRLITEHNIALSKMEMGELEAGRSGAEGNRRSVRITF